MFTLDDDKIMQDAKVERPFFALSCFSAMHRASYKYLLTLHKPAPLE